MASRTVYDTADVTAADRVAYWRNAVCESYVKLGCEIDDRRHFEGRIELAHHETLSISRVRGRAHRVERRRIDISASSDAFFLCSLQTTGSSVVEQFGQRSVLRTGDMTLYSSTDPYALALDGCSSQIVLQLPSERLLERLPQAAMMTARRIDGHAGIGRLVRENIAAFSEHMTSDNPVVRRMIQDTLVDLIATGLAEGLSATADLSLPEQHVMLRARSLIAGTLSDPDLDRNAVAARMGMSVRRLNSIFAKHGTSLGDTIRRMRIDAVKSELDNPASAGLSISEVAFRHGFSNIQNFSTLFKTQVGLCPRNYRRRPQR